MARGYWIITTNERPFHKQGEWDVSVYKTQIRALRIADDIRSRNPNAIVEVRNISRLPKGFYISKGTTWRRDGWGWLKKRRTRQDRIIALSTSAGKYYRFQKEEY